MPAKLPVPVGERFGHLTVVGPAPNIGSSTAWLCRCDCGRKKSLRCGSVRRGFTRSCGCGQNREKHGYAKKGAVNPVYWVWSNMKVRCQKPSCPEWKNYGARGITVCERWLASFENFLEDMGEKPEWATGGIDRIDNDGNYEPTNCRWSTREQQRTNQRRDAK